MRVLKDDGTMYLMTATQYMPYIDIFMQITIMFYHILFGLMIHLEFNQKKKLWFTL
jgi:site-specific DNA-methyltransferase (adenine-specific)